MKKINLGQLASSDATRITSVISKKLKENDKKSKGKINLVDLAEKLADRKLLAETEEDEDKE